MILTKVDSFTLVFQKMSVWRQVLGIQPLFSKAEKEICDSLIANTVAF